MRAIQVLAAFSIFIALLLSPGAMAEDAKKPLLFFHMGGKTIGLGGFYTEVEYSKVLGEVHDRMIPALTKTFGTTIVNHEFKSDDPTGSEIATVCAQTGAVGAIEAFDSFGAGPSDTFRGAFTLAVVDCTGSEFFSETGASSRTRGKFEIGDLVFPAMEDAYGRLQKDIDGSPKASANYERYGVYMTSQEADSFWLPDIEGKKTIVDVCQPLGTASRAGLRVGDEVRSIDGVPTVGIDIDALNAAMKHALASNSWTLEIVGRDKTTRTITFENQTVAWYAEHPLSPVEIPVQHRFSSLPEKRVLLTY